MEKGVLRIDGNRINGTTLRKMFQARAHNLKIIITTDNKEKLPMRVRYLAEDNRDIEIEEVR